VNQLGSLHNDEVERSFGFSAGHFGPEALNVKTVAVGQLESHVSGVRVERLLVEAFEQGFVRSKDVFEQSIWTHEPLDRDVGISGVQVGKIDGGASVYH